MPATPVRPAGKAEFRGYPHQVGERVSFHLLHHLTSVRLHRGLTDTQLATDLFIQQTRDDQRHDLPFAGSEGRVTVAERLQLRLVTKGKAALVKRLAERAPQHVIIEWLRQELDCPLLSWPDPKSRYRRIP